MVEPEMAYARLDDVMALSERMLSTLRVVCSTNGKELKVLERIRQSWKQSSTIPGCITMMPLRCSEGHTKGELESSFEWAVILAPDETISRAVRSTVMVITIRRLLSLLYGSRRTATELRLR